MSDIQAYDTAVLKYLSQICPRTYYSITSKAKEKCAKMNKDRTAYPFISFYRDTDLEIDSTRMNYSVIKGHFTHMGSQTSPSDPRRKTYYEHFIPVNLLYQVDIWSANHADLLKLSQDLMIDLKSARPVLQVPTADNGIAKFEFHDVSWVDNSDLEDETETGRTYRHTVSFTIQAYITRVRMEHQKPFDPDDITYDIYE